MNVPDQVHTDMHAAAMDSLRAECERLKQENINLQAKMIQFDAIKRALEDGLDAFGGRADKLERENAELRGRAEALRETVSDLIKFRWSHANIAIEGLSGILELFTNPATTKTISESTPLTPRHPDGPGVPAGASVQAPPLVIKEDGQ